MKAKIIMIVDGEEYPYGTYPFETPEEVLKVNKIAEKVREQRKIEVYVAEA